MKDGLEPLDPRDVVAIEQVAALHAALLPGSPISRLGDRKSTRLNSSHIQKSRMPSSA